jgi:hypothetical protein
MNTAENELYSPKKGAMISVKNSIREIILSFFKEALEKKIFDAVLIPVQVPAGDSYTWILIEDVSLFKDAAPVAPIMPVQGANALSSLTRKGKGNLKIAAIMRPCEIRAAIELAKLEQVHLENVFLIVPVPCLCRIMLKTPRREKKYLNRFLLKINGMKNQSNRFVGCAIISAFLIVIYILEY